jgi:hypothetical protein
MTDAEQVIADAIRESGLGGAFYKTPSKIAAALRAHPEAVRDLLPPDEGQPDPQVRWPCCPWDDDQPCPQAETGHDLPCNGPHCLETFALLEAINAKRGDADFMARVRARVNADAPILARLDAATSEQPS